MYLAVLILKIIEVLQFGQGEVVIVCLVLAKGDILLGEPPATDLKLFPEVLYLPNFLPVLLDGHFLLLKAEGEGG